MHLSLLLLFALPPAAPAAYEVKPLLPARFDALEVVGPGLVAACAPQTHLYLARCQGAPVRFFDLAGRPVGPTEPVVIEYRTDRILIFSAAAKSAPGQAATPNGPRRWGMMTTDGRLYLPPVWTKIQILGANSLAYTTEVPCPVPGPNPPPAPALCLKMGIIDLARRGALPPFYETIMPDNEAPFAVTTGRGRWGYVDDAGRELVSPTFDAAARCVDGLCRATKGNLTVFFDRSGRQTMVRTVLPVEDFSEGLAAFRAQDGRYGFLNRSGRIAIPARFTAVGDFHDGLAAVMVGSKGGFIDRTGKIKVPMKWTEVPDYEDGFGRALLRSSAPGGPTTSETAFFDARGRPLWRGPGRLTHYGEEGFLIIYDSERSWYGALDPVSRRFVIPMQNAQVTVGPSGLFHIQKGLTLAALFDHRGQALVPLAEQTIRFNAAGVIVTSAGAAPRSVLLAPDGRRRLTTQTYDQLAGWDRVPHLGTFRRKTTGGLMDAQGRERCAIPGAVDGEFVTNATPVLELRYYPTHSTGAFRHDFAADGLVKFRVAGKWGLYDLDCREVSPPVWEELAMMREWMIPAKSGGRWGVLRITPTTQAPGFSCGRFGGNRVRIPPEVLEHAPLLQPRPVHLSFDHRRRPRQRQDAPGPPTRPATGSVFPTASEDVERRTGVQDPGLHPGLPGGKPPRGRHRKGDLRPRHPARLRAAGEARAHVRDPGAHPAVPAFGDHEKMQL